jgi:hypothetical protein
MPWPSGRSFLCALLILSAGCLGGSPSSQSTTDTVESETPDCLTPENGNGASPQCLIEEYPPGLQYANFDSESHNLSVRITRNNSTVVFSRNATVQPGSAENPDFVRWYNVVDSSGTYTITATIDNSSTASLTRTFDERYRGSGGPEWQISILPNGTVELKEMGHQ